MSSLIYVHESIGLVTLARTGFAIFSNDAGVVVGLIVGESFQHQPHLTHSFQL